MDCWRQWIRHRTANVNEYSTRYSGAINAVQRTKPSEWRLQSQGNRQGSSGYISNEIGEKLSGRENEIHQLSRAVYQERLKVGVPREQARKDLPLSTSTEAYWKMDLHNLLHFLSLRMDAHAQKEIRAYATVVGKGIVASWCPLVWDAFVDYRLEACFFSRIEMKLLRAIIAGDEVTTEKFATERGLLIYGKRGLKRNQEREEFEAKLANLGLVAPRQSKNSPSVDSINNQTL